jgi:hypothetical protein
MSQRAQRAFPQATMLQDSLDHILMPTLHEAETHQMFALVGHVLRDFGEEIQGAEDLKVAARSALQVTEYPAESGWQNRRYATVPCT